MSRSLHSTDTATIAPVKRGQRVGRPPVRRTGTRAAVIAAELSAYGYLTAADANAEA